MIVSLPLLRNHDPEQAIGQLFERAGRLCFEFYIDITKDQLFEVFGHHSGIIITEADYAGATMIVRRGELVEFSL